MRFFTNKGIVQKTVIALLIVILTTFAVPKTVQADVGGKLMSPILNFVVAIFDGVQYLLEMAMLGETQFFLKDIKSTNTYGYKEVLGSEGNYYVQESDIPTITTDKFIDAIFFGMDAVNIPVINYTPEAIFSNQVPALDVNFIKPSVTAEEGASQSTQAEIEKRNIAMRLQPIIASWYSALRIIAIVGLLSVLVYLGIRMLLTSVAADRAKYKKMLMDWIIGMCLVFTLHYIMAFAMTMAETVTAMLSSKANGTFIVLATEIDGIAWTNKQVAFSSNLMSYVRFMVQAGDLHVKLAFFGLYIMLVIFSIRFTWIYLKRVVNMAFLTLMAPLVALMYPIDKAGDGKAQAFDMWLKEYTYNALIQPVDLLLYKVLLGSAIELAADNAIYAIVALGFIIAAENLIKKMFGFGKASGGTLGSLAGAAGVTAFAGKMLNDIGKKGPSGGGNGKVRTKDIPERSGKDKGGNEGIDAFKDKDPSKLMGTGADIPPPDGGNNPEEKTGGKGGSDVPAPEEEKPTLDDLEQEKADLYNQGYTDDSEEIKAINDKIYNGDWQDKEDKKAEESAQTPPSSKKDPEEQSLWDVMKQDTRNFGKRLGDRKDEFKNTFGTVEGRQALGDKIRKGARKRAIGAWKALPTVGYKAARGTLRTASRVALAGAMGTMGAIIGATTGDGDKAISMAMGAAGVGFVTGDNLFDATVGQAMPDKSIRDSYEAGIHGNKDDAKKARADKAYFRSEKFDDFYEKYYKDKGYTKKDVQSFVQDYRKAGITDQSEIRRAKKLEETYRKQNPNLKEEDVRKQVQSTIQMYKDMGISNKTFSDERMKDDAMGQLYEALGGKNTRNEQIANQIFSGFNDWRNSAI